MSTKNPELESLAADSWSVTKSKIVKFNHTWKIENFSFYQRDKVIVSPPFTAVPDDEIQWCLKVFPNGKNEESKDHVSIYLSLVSCKLTGLPAKYRIAILNARKETVQSMENNDALRFKCGRGWGFGRFISRDFLLTNCEGSLPKDTLTVFCEVTALSETEFVTGRNSLKEDGFYDFSQHPMSDRQEIPEREFPLRSRFADEYPTPSEATYESQIPEDQPAWSARASDLTGDDQPVGNKVPNVRDYKSSFVSARDLIAVLQKENQLLTDMLDDMKLGMLRSIQCLQNPQENPPALPLDYVKERLRSSQAADVFENTQRCLRSQAQACTQMLNDLTKAEEVLQCSKPASTASSAAPTNPFNLTCAASPERTQSSSSTDQPATSFGFSRNPQEDRMKQNVQGDRFATVPEYLPGNSRSAPESLEGYARASVGTFDDAIRSKSLDLPRTCNLSGISFGVNVPEFSRVSLPRHENAARPVKKVIRRKTSEDLQTKQRKDAQPSTVFNYRPYPPSGSIGEPRLDQAGPSR